MEAFLRRCEELATIRYDYDLTINRDNNDYTWEMVEFLENKTIMRIVKETRKYFWSAIIYTNPDDTRVSEVGIDKFGGRTKRWTAEERRILERNHYTINARAKAVQQI